MTKTKKTIIIGIDPGLADTGFGIIEKKGNKLNLVDYGCIKTSPKETPEKRLLEIHDQLIYQIKKHKPDIISVEKLFFCKNVKTALAVGQARGIIIMVAGKCLIKTVEYTPLQIKQALTSYGRASKEQIQQMVKTVLSLKQIPKPDDAADALAAAICCAHSCK